MIRLLIVTLAVNAAVLQASGFDDMILWRYDLPVDSQSVFSLEPSRVCRKGLQAVFLYSRPYSIEDLGWNTAAAGYGFGRVGYFGRFSSYGYDNYYTRNVYSGGIACRIADNLHASAEARYQHEKFLGVGGFGDIKLGFNASYEAGRLSAVFGLSDITLKNDYGPRGNPIARPWAGVSYLMENEIGFIASIKRTENSRTRWLFQQQIGISRAVDLYIGILNRPNVLYGSLDISYRSVTLLLTYYSVGRLDDTIVLGLGVGS